MSGSLVVVPWYLRQELHGDPSRGGDARLRIVISIRRVTLIALDPHTGDWDVTAIDPPEMGALRPLWGVVLERADIVALLSFDSRARTAVMETDGGRIVVPYLRAAVPDWLVGRWAVDTRRLDEVECSRLGAGVVEVGPDRLAYFGFAEAALIDDREWGCPEVTTRAGGLPSLGCVDFDDVTLEVLEREGCRIRVALSGMDGFPWGAEFPLVKE